MAAVVQGLQKDAGTDILSTLVESLRTTVLEPYGTVSITVQELSEDRVKLRITGTYLGHLNSLLLTVRRHPEVCAAALSQDHSTTTAILAVISRAPTSSRPIADIFHECMAVYRAHVDDLFAQLTSVVPSQTPLATSME